MNFTLCVEDILEQTIEGVTIYKVPNAFKFLELMSTHNEKLIYKKPFFIYSENIYM